MIAVALVSAVKDLRRRLADPVALVIWLGIPLLVGSLMSLVSGGSGTAARGVVLVANEDEGLVGLAVLLATSVVLLVFVVHRGLRGRLTIERPPTP